MNLLCPLERGRIRTAGDLVKAFPSPSWYAIVLAFEVIFFQHHLELFDMAVVHVFISRDCCNNSC